MRVKVDGGLKQGLKLNFTHRSEDILKKRRGVQAHKIEAFCQGKKLISSIKISTVDIRFCSKDLSRSDHHRVEYINYDMI